MSLSGIFLRLASTVVLVCVTITCTAQSEPSSETKVKPAILKRLQTAQSENTKITVIETDGSRVRGVVTDIRPDYVSITVQYGQPTVHVPYDRLDHIDTPSLGKHGKIVLGIVATASVIGIVFLVTAAIKHT